MYIADLNGNIIDDGSQPIEGANVSVYQKVGETQTDADGNYSNITPSSFSEFLVEFTKTGYHRKFKDASVGGTINACMQLSDSSEPDLPTGISASDNQTGDSILLTWVASDFEFVAGYNIYRSTDLTLQFQRINSSLIRDSSFLDTGVEPFVDYYYILEVVSANSACYLSGKTSRTAIIGPISIDPAGEAGDITLESKLKIDSTKTNREGEKVFDGDLNTWWESRRGAGAWIELVFPETKYFHKFYFRKRSLSRGITFATLQYHDGTQWVDIQKVDYLQAIEHTFAGFVIQGTRIRLFVNKVEPLTETELTEIRVYGS